MNLTNPFQNSLILFKAFKSILILSSKFLKNKSEENKKLSKEWLKS